MIKLLTILTISLAATTAFAAENGNTNVAVMSTAKMAVVDITGSAAASLYELLEGPAKASKTVFGATIKEGKRITCYLSYMVVGIDMISPIVPKYRCSLIVSSDGDIDANDEVTIEKTKN